MVRIVPWFVFFLFNEGGLTETPYLLSGYLRKYCNDTKTFRNTNKLVKNSFQSGKKGNIILVSSFGVSSESCQFLIAHIDVSLSFTLGFGAAPVAQVDRDSMLSIS